jgi:V/A-type H+-transporting ATPase subunit E
MMHGRAFVLDSERFLEMTKKVNTNNAFVRLVLGKIEGNWCIKRGCTTCGCRRFTLELEKDPEGLLKAIYELKREDVEHLDYVWTDCLELTLAYLHHLRTRPELPLICEYAEERYYEHSKWCYEMQMKYGTFKKEKTKEEKLANIAKDEEEKKAAAERKKERIRIYWDHVKSCLEVRARVMEKFDSLHSPGEKLAMIAEDKKRLPADIKDKLKGALTEKNGASLTISEETVSFCGGFLLLYGDIEENCTFDALFAAAREELQDKINAFLYSETMAAKTSKAKA